MLPVSGGIYDFRTDARDDTFTVTTTLAVTSATVQLFKPIYDDDVSTITLSSDDVDDAPIYTSYNSTSRALVMDGLDDSTTRTITTTYDVDAINMASLGTFLDILPFIWIILWVAFPVAGLAAIWLGAT